MKSVEDGQSTLGADQEIALQGHVTKPFVGSSIEFLQHCQQAIAEQESFKGILKRYVTLLSDYFGLSHAAYTVLEGQRHESTPRRSAVRFPPLRVIDEALLQKVKPVVTGLLSKEEDTRHGFSTVRVNDQEYYFAMFDDPTGEIGLLLWRQPVLTMRSPLLKQLSDQPENMAAVLDFITRNAQQTCRWLRRLDSTQAMLYQDEVTGLYNYRYLDVALDSELKRLQRFHTPFSLLFIDLDDFKKINDVHGHLTGSSVLRQVGEVIKLAVRDVDNVIRYGGDEFVVVLIGAGSRQAFQAAERVRSKVQGAVFKSEDRKPLELTVSIGIASCPEHGRDKTSILRLADETMYASKRGGKNRVMMMTPGGVTTSVSEGDSTT